MSVIPVHGDKLSSNPKKPGIAWKPYQKRLAAANEVERWFGGKFAALGIVCGRISRLMVIDFDDYAGYQRFCRRFPEYANSYTVKTRRGFHVYSRTGVKVGSQGFDGGDIKGEGGFVIAPPSIIAGVRYELVDGEMGPELDRLEVDEIVNFLVAGKGRREIRAGSEGVVDLVGMYKRLSQDVGRNNALYRCASVGREGGMSESMVVDTLAGVHTMERSGKAREVEDRRQRWLEALRTIRSAYQGRSLVPEVGGLPNSVREFLLKSQGSSIVVRLLDIFVLSGWNAGEWYSCGDMVEQARRHGLSRRSVLEALVGSVSVYRGRPIIKRRYVEYVDGWGLNVKRRGRPVEKLYEVPRVADLVRLFGVAWSPSDCLGSDDVKSAHAYRLALHREYIRRLSPEVPQAWLGRRLGVSGRSIRRFNSELGVRSKVKVGVFDLRRDRLRLLPKRRRDAKRWATPGYWLETSDGRRWPAWRHVGSALLMRFGSNVEVCMRRAAEVRLDGYDGVVREPMDAGLFARVEMWRRVKEGGEKRGGVVKRLLGALKREADVVRFKSVPLFFDSVARHIARDRVAETIDGYLVARDEDGRLVRRPALRGVAYRMLKEFGNGNVEFALRDGWSGLRYAIARRFGEDEGSGWLMGPARDWGE